MNGMFGLNCAKAILIQLAIVAIPIAIIADTKRMPISLTHILCKDAANMYCPRMSKFIKLNNLSIFMFECEKSKITSSTYLVVVFLKAIKQKFYIPTEVD